MGSKEGLNPGFGHLCEDFEETILHRLKFGVLFSSIYCNEKTMRGEEIKSELIKIKIYFRKNILFCIRRRGRKGIFATTIRDVHRSVSPRSCQPRVPIIVWSTFPELWSGIPRILRSLARKMPEMAATRGHRKRVSRDKADGISRGGWYSAPKITFLEKRIKTCVPSLSLLFLFPLMAS